MIATVQAIKATKQGYAALVVIFEHTPDEYMEWIGKRVELEIHLKED